MAPKIASAAFKPDPTVTAVGRAAARSKEVLNWALAIKDAGFSGSDSAILSLWTKMRDLNTIVLFLILIVFAFGLILHTSWAQNQKRTFVVLIIAMVASYLSFAILLSGIRGVDVVEQKLYNLTTKDSAGVATSRHLKAEDLLSVTFNYQDFIGYRNTDTNLNESVDNTVFLLKVACYTDYAVAGIIILRIVILWLLVVFSPFIFPLVAFTATRNVSVFWIKEFARWLFIGPLFALFLTAIPFVWQNSSTIATFLPGSVGSRKSGIPLESDSTATKPQNIYQSGTNVVLSPPGIKDANLQIDTKPGSGNNLSDTDTYSRYIVAFLMILVALVLPFVLMRSIIIVVKTAGSSLWNYQVKASLQGLGAKIAPSVIPPPQAKSSLGLESHSGQSLPIAPTKSTKESAIQNAKRLVNPGQIKNLASLTSQTFESKTVNEMIRHQEVTSEKAPLEYLGRAETEILKSPETGSSTNAVLSNLRESERLPDQDMRNKFSATKNAIFFKQLDGSRAAKSLGDAISQNTSTIVGQNLKEKVVESNLKAITTTKDTSTIFDKITERARGGDENAQRAGDLSGRFDEFNKIIKNPVGEIVKSPELMGNVMDFSNKLTAGDNLNKAAQGQTSIDQDGINKLKSAFGSDDEAGKWQGLAHELRIQKDNGSKSAGTILQGAEDLTKISKTENETIENQVASSETTAGLTVDEDAGSQFEQVKNLWSNNYANAPVPEPEKFKSREQWLQNEVESLEKIQKGLVNEDTRDESVKELGKTVPYVLLGGYDIFDLIVYVKAKLKAAKEILANLIHGKAGDRQEEGANSTDKHTIADQIASQTNGPKT